MPQEALTPSMGAMSRSYRARSGGLANEFCLLGREEVPSLLGDTVPLNKLVMLWQLLGRQDEGRNQAHPPSFWLPAGPHSMPANSTSCSSLASYCHKTLSSVHNSIHLCAVSYIIPECWSRMEQSCCQAQGPGGSVQPTRKITFASVNLQPTARIRWPNPARPCLCITGVP